MDSLMVLDGGLGHLIKQWGVTIPGLPYNQQFLAGVLANETSPDTVTKAHTEYINAGCQCITTNNFVATKHSLSKVNRQADAQRLIELAGQLARQAVQDSKQQVLVAGSLPPLQESYQCTKLPGHQDMVNEYSNIADALYPFVDIYLAETLSTVAEAQAALHATAFLGKPVWVSFTLEDSSSCCLRSKEPLAAAVQGIRQYSHLTAVLLNCCAPAAVSAALPALKQHIAPGVKVGCYANGFKTTTTQWMTGGEQQGLLDTIPEDYDAEGLITPQAYLNHAKDWRAAGADLIGGCCGIGPEHMRLIAEYAAAVRQARQ